MAPSVRMGPPGLEHPCSEALFAAPGGHIGGSVRARAVRLRRFAEHVRNQVGLQRQPLLVRGHVPQLVEGGVEELAQDVGVERVEFRLPEPAVPRDEAAGARVVLLER